SYELPFGTGKKFASTGPVGKYILGGWTVAAIHNYQAGSPLNITGGQSVGIPGNITATANRALNVPERSAISCSDLEFGNPLKDHMLNAGNAAEAAATGLPLAYLPEGDYQLGNTPKFDPHARQCWTLNEKVAVSRNLQKGGDLRRFQRTGL